jgi:hypothetical protein
MGKVAGNQRKVDIPTDISGLLTPKSIITKGDKK